MHVILLQDVAGLGKQGDVARVADGYARNYLVPRGLAQLATDGRLKDIGRKQDAAQAREERLAAQAKGLSERLQGLTVHIDVRAGEKGKLFGSVGNQDIAQALLTEHGLTVERKRIVLKEPIRSLGEYTVTVRLHKSATCEIKVIVTGR